MLLHPYSALDILQFGQNLQVKSVGLTSDPAASVHVIPQSQYQPQNTLHPRALQQGLKKPHKDATKWNTHNAEGSMKEPPSCLVPRRHWRPRWACVEWTAPRPWRPSGRWCSELCPQSLGSERARTGTWSPKQGRKSHQYLRFNKSWLVLTLAAHGNTSTWKDVSRRQMLSGSRDQFTSNQKIQHYAGKEKTK